MKFQRSALVIQQDEDTSKRVGRVLDAMEIYSNPCCCAEEFKAKYVAETYELLIIDLYMDECDGVELLRWLIDRGNTVNVLLTVNGDWFMVRLTRSLVRDLAQFQMEAIEAPADAGCLKNAIARLLPRLRKSVGSLVRAPSHGKFGLSWWGSSLCFRSALLPLREMPK